MIVYFPERIYNKDFSNDEHFQALVKELEESLYQEDFAKIIKEYDTSNPLIQRISEYALEKASPEYKLELKLCLDDDINVYEKDFESMDVETKLYWLAEVDDGNMIETDKVKSRDSLFISLYEQYVKNHESEYSNFIHLMYYTKLVHNKIIETTKMNIFAFNLFLSYEKKVFEKMIKINDDERYHQMLYSKREHMYYLAFEYIGKHCEESIEIANIITQELDQSLAKYHDFSFFRLMFYNQCFHMLVDADNLSLAKDYWLKLCEMINWAFIHKLEVIKALNNYNNDFVEDFMKLVKYLYLLDKNFMTNHYLNIENMLTDGEKKYLENQNVETLLEGYSLRWAKPKIIAFEMI